MNISSEVKAAYKEGSHQKNLIVEFPDLNLTVPQDKVYYESFSLEESVFDGDSFEIVGCIASVAEVSIRDVGYELKDRNITISIELDDVENSAMPLFNGYVDSVELEANSNIRKLKCFDKLSKLANIDVADWYNNLSFPITIEDFRNSLFSHLQISQTFSDYQEGLVNDFMFIDKQYDPKTLSALDLIKNICQINAVFGIMNRNGDFEYRYLMMDDPESVPFYMDFQYQGFSVSAIDKITIRQSSDDLGASHGNGSNNYIIQGNFFTYGLDTVDLRLLATAVHDVIPYFTYIPFSASNYGYPWIECGLNVPMDYEVYDFDESQSQEADVYKHVSVIPFSRKLSGIQSLKDEYSAKGNKDQKVFISDLSSDIETIKQEIDNLDPESFSTSSDVATYKNTRSISILSGNNDIISDITIDVPKGGVCLFSQEISATVNSDEYTGDLEFCAYYYSNGKKIPSIRSYGSFSEGHFLLTLSKFWKVNKEGNYRFTTRLYPRNCDVKIEKSDSTSYLFVKQGEADEFQLVVQHEPDKIEYIAGENLDYTGLVIVKEYYDERASEDITEDVTEQCTIKPKDGSKTKIGQGTITCTATYVETDDLGQKSKYTVSFFCYVEDPEEPQFSIDLTREPYKLSYRIGEALDYKGLKVEKIYDDDTPNEDVTSQCTISPAEGTVYRKDKIITVHVVYTEDGNSYTNTFDVEYVKTPYDDENFLVPDPTDPYGDHSKQAINIPYVNFEVKVATYEISIYGLLADDIIGDRPDNVYIPASVTTAAGTTFVSIIY